MPCIAPFKEFRQYFICSLDTAGAFLGHHAPGSSSTHVCEMYSMLKPPVNQQRLTPKAL